LPPFFFFHEGHEEHQGKKQKNFVYFVTFVVINSETANKKAVRIAGQPEWIDCVLRTLILRCPGAVAHIHHGHHPHQGGEG